DNLQLVGDAHRCRGALLGALRALADSYDDLEPAGQQKGRLAEVVGNSLAAVVIADADGGRITAAVAAASREAQDPSP
ncbi:hypothetical protein H4R19_007284, partial [Coemansia spiralis]